MTKFLVICLLFCLCKAVVRTKVHVGVLVPMTPRFTGGFHLGDGIRPAIKAAFDDVNRDTNLLSAINLTYTIHDSACDSVKAVGIAADLMRSQTAVHAYIGPGCSVACLSAALLAQYWNKPIISYSCSSSELEDRNKYSTFARTQPFSRTYSRITPLILLQIMRTFKWKRAAILAKDETPVSIWVPMANNLNHYFKENNITVSYFNIYKTSTDSAAQYKNTATLLTETKKNARVIFIIGTRTEVSRLLVVAKTLEMLTGDYAFITLDFYVSETLRTSLKGKSWSLAWDEMLGLFEGIITLSVKKPGIRELQNLTKWLNTGMQHQPSYQNQSATSMAAQTTPYLYDAVWLYAHALNRTLTEGGDISDGTAIFRKFNATTPLFTGVIPYTLKGARSRYFGSLIET